MFKSSLILFFIFCLLLSFIIYQNKIAKKNKIEELQIDQVNKIILSYGNNTEVSDIEELVLKKEKSDWILNDKKIKNISKIKSILNYINELELKNLDTYKSDEELIKYGLDVPLVKLALFDKKGANFTLYLGDKSPVGGLRYGLVKNSNTIVTFEDIYDILLVNKEDLFKE
jgi:hypothetical protein